MFFAKLAASLALITPLVSALSIETPVGWQSQGPATINWTAVAGDPQTFSIELTNTVFNRQFALANNVETGAMSITFTLPVVPLSNTADYTVQFVNVANLTDVFAESAPFVISETVSTTSTSASSTTSGTSSASSSTSASTTSTTPIGTTRSASSASLSGTSTSTDTAVVGSSSAFDNGAVALGLSNTNLASFAVMAVAAVAGAGFVGL